MMISFNSREAMEGRPRKGRKKEGYCDNKQEALTMPRNRGVLF
jgi:hypothetical protein